MDTNVLVAALKNKRGYPARLFEAWMNDEFEIIASPDVLSEDERVLFSPPVQKNSSWNLSEAGELIEALKDATIGVPGALAVQVIVQDPTDDKFFIAAIEGQADYTSLKNNDGRNSKPSAVFGL
ncbi:MAG: putative toxin-antitoxin system toxin component, PIN family [candidate division KSB1 bacterium]|nr:putative toxin-antitoxin system toxin component, PIN family [candidate division KSB1 bacterium]MDZ7367129.1 putative toxin-antitoxin system toxin component, PIN family [candidate division KSB1 bacterium]MDZ7405107.1 putative toxin-antitoxin system toxin component, PIN family [candidate division KSB1 bacterium]